MLHDLRAPRDQMDIDREQQIRVFIKVIDWKGTILATFYTDNKIMDGARSIPNANVQGLP